MNILTGDALILALTTFWERLASFVPRLGGALLILLIGYVVAKISAKLSSALLQRLGFDRAWQRVKLSNALDEAGLKVEGSEIMGKVVFWFVMLLFFVSVSEMLGLTNLAHTLESVSLYVPRILGAGLLLVGGLVAADLLQRLAGRALTETGFDYGKAVGSLVFVLGVTVTIIVVVNQLGVEAELLYSMLQIVMGAAGIALALALGLGVRWLVQHLMAGIYARDQFSSGIRLRFKEHEGVLEEISAVSARLRRDDGTLIFIPNHQLLETVVTATMPEPEPPTDE